MPLVSQVKFKTNL